MVIFELNHRATSYKVFEDFSFRRAEYALFGLKKSENGQNRLSNVRFHFSAYFACLPLATVCLQVPGEPIFDPRTLKSHLEHFFEFFKI